MYLSSRSYILLKFVGERPTKHTKSYSHLTSRNDPPPHTHTLTYASVDIGRILMHIHSNHSLPEGLSASLGRYDGFNPHSISSTQFNFSDTVLFQIKQLLIVCYPPLCSLLPHLSPMPPSAVEDQGWRPRMGEKRKKGDKADGEEIPISTSVN